MRSFTEVVRDSLRKHGWEIYTNEEMPDPIHEWWWKPAEHKDYWIDSKMGTSDNYMPIDQAIAWQMREDAAKG